jgi:uncharacterized protein YecE (DUF72 family)
MNTAKRIHVGTSGWNYDHWIGPFYPEHLSHDQWLKYYAERFHTVEINNSFYHLPKPETFQHWRETTPDHFLFSVKASRYVTHMKRLSDPRQSLSKFIANIQYLGDKLGPLLFQLPPRWRKNAERLNRFLRAVPSCLRCVFEFRDSTWWGTDIYEILRRHNAAFCLFELAGEQTPKEVTADFVYIRLHGPNGAYQGQYNQAVLTGWAKEFRKWRKEGKEIFCYFDNDEAGYAAQDAGRLQKMLKGAH